MAIDSSGNLYGTAQYADGGIIFEMSADHVFSGLYGFPGSATDSIVPEGNLAIDPAGNLYGVTEFSSNGDTIYELSADHSTFTTLATFNASGGGTPAAISDGIGNVFVATPNAGVYGQGMITEIAADGTNNLVGSSGVTTIAPPLGVPPFAAETFTSISVAAGATVATTPSPTGHTVLAVNTPLARGIGRRVDRHARSDQQRSGYHRRIAGHSHQPGRAGLQQRNLVRPGHHLQLRGKRQHPSHRAGRNPKQPERVGSLHRNQPAGRHSARRGDILVKYTYYGDANLDGKVDASDYSRIDNGYLNHLTGWSNGDFNYDGVINGSDYTLIDNAFNMQGASLAAQISPAALAKSKQQAELASSSSQTRIGSTPGFANGYAPAGTDNTATGTFSWDDFLSQSKKKRIELPL